MNTAETGCHLQLYNIQYTIHPYFMQERDQTFFHHLYWPVKKRGGGDMKLVANKEIN